MTAPEITAFMPGGDGRRRRAFTVGGCEVQVIPVGDADDERARRMSEALATLAVGHAHRVADLELRLADAASQATAAKNALATVTAKIPPKRPAQLLGPGYVRFRDAEMWILNRRERGFGEWGVICDGWDDLFRRYNVRVTGHGQDEHGLWWEVQP